MSSTFFVDWQLWEQMTFVLAGAIVLVFCLGWAKLWRVSRRNRKQAVVDEENVMKIQELRISGAVIKSRLENHVPFGIRALESGVEIDGIWISTSKTSVSENVKKLRDLDHSSNPSLESKDGERPSSLEELSPPRASFSGPLQPTLQPNQAPPDHSNASEVFRSPGLKTLSQNRASAYKPKRSSHLRFSSYGDIQVNQDTLSQLEGIATTAPEKAHHKRSPHRQASTEDSSSDTAAENERSSGTDSDGSITSKEVTSETHQLVRATSLGTVSKRSRRDNGHGSHESRDSTSSTRVPSRSEYSCVIPDSPPRSKLIPFSSSDAPPALGSIAMRVTNRLPTDETEAIGESQWPLLSKKQPISATEPIFKPGSLHLNKSVRKVNSGFEVLPAGTFDLPDCFVRKNSKRDTSLLEPKEGDEEKRSKKLQKRGHDSITGIRMSKISGKF